MADGNNIRCFDADCNCSYEKASSLTRFRKGRGKGQKAVSGKGSYTKAKEEAVKAATEQSGDSETGL